MLPSSLYMGATTDSSGIGAEGSELRLRSVILPGKSARIPQGRDLCDP